MKVSLNAIRDVATVSQSLQQTISTKLKTGEVYAEALRAAQTLYNASVISASRSKRRDAESGIASVLLEVAKFPASEIAASLASEQARCAAAVDALDDAGLWSMRAQAKWVLEAVESGGLLDAGQPLQVLSSINSPLSELLADPTTAPLVQSAFSLAYAVLEGRSPEAILGSSSRLAAAGFDAAGFGNIASAIGTMAAVANIGIAIATSVLKSHHAAAQARTDAAVKQARDRTVLSVRFSEAALAGKMKTRLIESSPAVSAAALVAGIDGYSFEASRVGRMLDAICTNSLIVARPSDHMLGPGSAMLPALWDGRSSSMGWKTVDAMIEVVRNTTPSSVKEVREKHLRSLILDRHISFQSPTSPYPRAPGAQPTAPYVRSTVKSSNGKHLPAWTSTPNRLDAWAVADGGLAHVMRKIAYAKDLRRAGLISDAEIKVASWCCIGDIVDVPTSESASAGVALAANTHGPTSSLVSYQWDDAATWLENLID